MHRSLAIAFLGIAFIVGGMMSATASPGSFKVGFVDFDQILLDTPTGKRATAAFEKELNKKQAELDKEQKKLQAAAAELQKQRALLKPDVLKQKEAELQKGLVALQETYVKLERDLVEQRTKLIQEIIKQARPVITDIAKQNGYDLIVDRTIVVWGDSSYDLTSTIKARMK